MESQKPVEIGDLRLLTIRERGGGTHKRGKAAEGPERSD